MARMSNEELVNAYARAHETDDGDAMGALRDPDWTAELPQSGELIRGHANDRAISAAWPGGHPGARVQRIIGTEDRWVATPAWTIERVAGSGDMWFVEADAIYPDGSDWSAVIVIELREGKVLRERWHFGQPFEAPTWRAPFVERMDAGETSHRS
jgi:hypothetical protein